MFLVIAKKPMFQDLDLDCLCHLSYANKKKVLGNATTTTNTFWKNILSDYVMVLPCMEIMLPYRSKIMKKSVNGSRNFVGILLFRGRGSFFVF